MDSTKTGAEHVIPCHSIMIETIEALVDAENKSPFLFVNPRARREGKRYTSKALELIWDKACARAGENITLYAGLKHSSISQMINEKGMPLSDVQVVSDHARLESLKAYEQTTLARKRELMETPNREEIKDLLRKVK